MPNANLNLNYEFLWMKLTMGSFKYDPIKFRNTDMVIKTVSQG